ncbi:phosphoesterase [Tepidimicrobium xylanilyticum]|uniref:Calcineurin-like phosphoesterase domain-containing protein n=1 Tax=Tepidimicrobium xylanilyticum TaxID=1123352 RepID=A0A1H3E8D5_9FIRM|nr:hypothetical protein SAMN05660923_02862 [Tepidimicrobium xylanilyticum]
MKLIGIFGLFLVGIFIYNYIQISKFFINKLSFQTNKLSKSLRITQISDYHSNNLINKKRLLDEISQFNPHIIALTGDIIDSRAEEIYPTLDLIKELTKINSNIYFVIGNHELRNINGNTFIENLKEVGVTVLDNENTIIQIEDEKVNICGLSFFATKEDYENILAKINKDYFTLLLSHSPNRIIRYTKGIEDLILTGHTHGGQVRLPIIGAIVSSGQGLFPKYDKGVFNIKNTILYIDSGLGNSLFPIRFFNRVQICNITIESTKNS